MTGDILSSLGCPPRNALCAVAAVGLFACGSLDDHRDGDVAAPLPATPGEVRRFPVVGGADWGWLAPDADNPRYLRATDEHGSRPFAIASYGTLVPCSFDGSQAARLKRQGATYAVVWHQWSTATSSLATAWAGSRT